VARSFVSFPSIIILPFPHRLSSNLSASEVRISHRTAVPSSGFCSCRLWFNRTCHSRERHRKCIALGLDRIRESNRSIRGHCANATRLFFGLTFGDVSVFRSSVTVLLFHDITCPPAPDVIIVVEDGAMWWEGTSGDAAHSAEAEPLVPDSK
jgi:hypothetical protein